MLNTYFNVNRYIRTEEEFIKNKVPWAGHSMVWLGGGVYVWRGAVFAYECDVYFGTYK